MQYLLFGLAALALALFALRGFTFASTPALARSIRLAGATVAFAGAVAFAIRGSAAYAIPLAMAGLWLLAAGRGGFGSIRGAGAPGRTSRITTDFLEVELDHDTGEVTGKVLSGMFRGRDIERLKPADLALLWQDCRFADPPSAQIVEAYLDRVHPTWREDMARGEAEMAQGPDGRMTREEAAEILGLPLDADEERIRKAHRDLMMKLHPDRGGSTYLAAKINEAKDVLLARP